jgi:hypothetical protein
MCLISAQTFGKLRVVTSMNHKPKEITMESWIIPTIAVIVAASGLWWKVTTSMATKADISQLRTELKDDIREIRQMLFAHIGSHSHINDSVKTSDS